MPRKSPATSLSASPSTLSSPYHRPLPRDVEVDPDPLLLRLDFHRESVVLHEFQDGTASSRLVSALDVAHALASELDLDTGLLPQDALWYVKTATGARVAVWRPPRIWTVRLREQYGRRARRFQLPMPALIFVCPQAAQAPYVFAAAGRPRSWTSSCITAPCSTSFATGASAPARTCSHAIRRASRRTSSTATSRRPATAAAVRGATPMTCWRSGPNCTARRRSRWTT